MVQVVRWIASLVPTGSRDLFQQRTHLPAAAMNMIRLDPLLLNPSNHSLTPCAALCQGLDPCCD